MNILSDKIAKLEHSATEEVDNTVKRMKQAGVTDIVSLGVGEPCFDTPDNIKKAAWDALRAGDTKYQPTAGSYALREEISKKFQRENGIKAGVDDIVVTSGAKFALYLAFQAILQDGDQVMLLDPAWVSYEAMAKIAGAGVVRVPTDEDAGFQPDLKAIKKELKKSVKIILVNSPCNPTGAVYDKPLIRKIAEMAKDNKSLFVSDESTNLICKDYSAGSEYDHVLTVNAFSKSHAMTGWRLGYVTGPRDVLEGMIKIYQHSTSCVTAFAQAGGIEALRSETSRHAAQDMVKGYRERRAIMVKLIEESEFFEMKRLPQGAFYCFPAYHLKKPSLELSKGLKKSIHGSRRSR
jgi:aspartate aminotransferase